MVQIIAGRFDAQENAEQAYHALQDAGFDAASLSIFFVNPHGQHGIYPIGGDEGASPGSKDAGKGALAGAGAGSVAGAVAGSLAGPVGAVIGGGVGAYAGSLAGAVESTSDASEADEAGRGEPDDHFTERKSGVHVAVNVSDSDAQQLIDLLRKHQARDVEQAEGNLENGDWVDFDPSRAVRLV